MSKILIVDDDLALADVLVFTLRRAGFETLLAHNGSDALELFAREAPDLLVLDWSLPGMDGLEVCTRIRSVSNTPILMLTVHQSDDDVVAALEAGADEYVTKPFSPRQLVARIRSLLRRTIGETKGALTVGSLTLHLERRELVAPGHPPTHLTRLETRLMQALMQNPGRILPAESLVFRVWGQGGATQEMLKQLVYRLRNKLVHIAADRSLLENVPGEGYVLNLPDQAPGN
jgi:two-component system response regulator MtrA